MYMKTIIVTLVAIFLFVILGSFLLGYVKKSIDGTLTSQPIATLPSPTPLPTPTQTKDTFLFVPYWALSNSQVISVDQQTLIYFGIEATKAGLSMGESGALNLSTFTRSRGQKRSLLAIRMINNEENFDILKDKDAQEKIIEDSILLAKENDFSGIVLNLELSALPFESLVEQITFFNREFFLESKKSDLSYYITAYGDTYYRVRPFNFTALSRDSDGIFIMAYDLHKARGNPGPNFPLRGKDEYGYDIESMLGDFSNAVDAQKITVVFGMYGYDWEVDDDGSTVSEGEALSLKEAESRLIDGCLYEFCNWERDQDAGEVKVEYKDASGRNHLVWFEDLESVKRKESYLNSRGIKSFAYWAYSYF